MLLQSLAGGLQATHRGAEATTQQLARREVPVSELNLKIQVLAGEAGRPDDL